MRLGARDKYDSSWKEIAKATVQREHICREVQISLARRDRFDRGGGGGGGGVDEDEVILVILH